jgi:putative peptidoglycan lipid II flippase
MVGLTLPAAALMAINISPLVQTAFGFTPEGTSVVVWAARAYLLGLVGHSLIEVLARAFYARQNAKTPLIATAANMAAFVILSLLLFRTLGSPGIALSNSLAFTLEALLLLVLLHRQFPAILRQGKEFLRLVLGTAASAAVSGLTLWLLPLSPILSALIALAIGGLVLLPFILPEIRELPQL